MPTLSACELVWTSFDKPSKIYKKVSTDLNRFHPTQKPVEVYEFMLQYCKINENFKIIDTHLGSGSIAIAIDKVNTLDKKNLQFVGIELDPDYYRAAVERFKNHKRQCVRF